MLFLSRARSGTAVPLREIFFRTSVVHEQSDAVEQAWTRAFLQRKVSTEPQLLLVMLDSLLTELFRGGKSSANSTLCLVILKLVRVSVKQICGVLSLSSRANSRASPRAMITALGVRADSRSDKPRSIGMLNYRPGRSGQASRERLQAPATNYHRQKTPRDEKLFRPPRGSRVRIATFATRLKLSFSTGRGTPRQDSQCRSPRLRRMVGYFLLKGPFSFFFTTVKREDAGLGPQSFYPRHYSLSFHQMECKFVPLLTHR